MHVILDYLAGNSSAHEVLPMLQKTPLIVILDRVTIRLQ